MNICTNRKFNNIWHHSQLRTQISGFVHVVFATLVQWNMCHKLFKDRILKKTSNPLKKSKKPFVISLHVFHSNFVFINTLNEIQNALRWIFFSCLFNCCLVTVVQYVRINTLFFFSTRNHRFQLSSYGSFEFMISLFWNKNLQFWHAKHVFCSYLKYLSFGNSEKQ